ncbi:phage late control D family protein [Demequina mangrovi]|uniref:Phage late control gene D protein (GPD) n=1 Tax=Demequina mangrovi TaxID=1043493 RepID=A0A1H6TRS8_9MICO|nr:contractile injection system protein, VgrG/Pvc8 family [Demequina mangrovi]SEI82741.1 Phage late control gene D protein (GPD) [Demequina mangrovi]
MTDALLAVASPVFTVAREVVGTLARDCVRLTIDEGVDGLRTLEARFVASGIGAAGPPGPMLHLDGSEFDFGTEIQVAVGGSGAQHEVFDGAVSAIEAVFGDSEPPAVVMLAEDPLMRLRMTRRMRTYTDVTDADVVRQLAQEHGLDADVAAEGPRHDVLQQINQSDLAFLRERARLLQTDLWCRDGTLHLSDRPSRTGARITLLHGGDLLTCRISADLAHQRTEVVVSGYNTRTEDVIDERAGAEAIQAEAQPGRTGPQVLEQAFGASAGMRVREVPETAAQASAWARAEMLRRSRRFVTVHGTTRGTPQLDVGSQVRLELVGPPFDGDGYYVTRVTHTYDNVRGLRTSFQAERATLNEAA